MDIPNYLKSELPSNARTAGDGMEFLENSAELKTKFNKTENRKSPSAKVNLLPGRLVQVFPSNNLHCDRTKTQFQSKSPKFVPYEPYTAATKPIVSYTGTKHSKKGSRNNMDINKLIAQMSKIDTRPSEFKPRAKQLSVSEKSVEASNAGIDEELQKKNAQLIAENESLKEQLKQQAQVNKELKTMLVASMGEDLEFQVHSLNEDKKHLANALLNSAKHLSTHQEQTEWLAGQCEVWRSKFLASSLMVEELANWKKVLQHRTEELEQAVKQLLDERYRARDMMLCTYKNLYSLHENWLESVAISEYVGNRKMYDQPIGNLNLNATSLSTSNILDLSSVNLKLSENLSCSIEKQDILHVHALPAITSAEKVVENIMATPLEVKRVNEVPLNALVSHAYSTSGTTSRPIASCVHCNGQIQLL